MTHSQQLSAISHFLREHQYLHEQELLRRYPAPLPHPYSEWIEEMKNWSVEELADFESHLSVGYTQNPEFSTFVKTIKELIDIPKSQLSPTPLSSDLKRGMTPKKVHEVAQLSGILSFTENIIDIGGGKGHLSATLVHQHSCRAISIDMDEQLQKQGKKRLQKWLPDTLPRLQFYHQKVDNKHPIPTAPTPKDTTLIGLHCCGDLSSQLIQQGIQQQLGKIINFGCCYHHIQADYNLSNAGRLNPIWFSHEALHLAAHSYRYIDKKALEQRFRVKRYRYALHYYLTDHFDASFTRVGDGKTDDYQGSFSAYAKKFAAEIPDTTPNRELDTFFQQRETQLLIQNKILGDILRNLLGRLIELYIVLDRCVFLEENGYEVQLKEYFDRKISSRNLGITAKMT